MEKLSVEQIVARLESECQHGIWRPTREWEIIFNSLSPAQIDRLMSAVRHLVLAPAQEELRRVLFSRWAECDPAAALTFARGLPEAKIKAKVELERLLQAHPEGKRPTYVQGGIDAFKHFLARHSSPKSAEGLDLGEPCL